MKLMKFFSRQARKPSGLYGRFVMSRIFEKGNKTLNDMVCKALDLKGQERVLEIGFGTGSMVEQVACRLDSGQMTGVDFSDTMVAKARRRNHRHIKSGRVTLHAGDFMDVDLEPGSFDRIFSVNTLYFWPDPREAMVRLSSLLAPGGSLILGFGKKEDLEQLNLDRSIFRFYSVDEVKRLLTASGGLEVTRVCLGRSEGLLGFCVVAQKGEARP